MSYIFVHVPKTAGTSFLSILKKAFKHNMKTDYLDIINLNAVILHKVNTSFKYPHGIKQYKMIGGHFNASKYLYLKRPYIAWVRNPVDRAISHYYYWKMLWKKPRKRNWDDGLSKLFESGMDLVQFSEIFSNQMSYFLDVDLDNFKFIGVVEHYNKCLDIFSKLFNINANHDTKLNVGNKHDVSKDIRNKIAGNHKQDFDLYYKVLDKLKIK